jgi:hypothetical protein
MEFWLSRSLSHEFSFFTVEFRLSRSLSHGFSFFSWWNLGYHGAFHTNFLFSQWWNLGYHGAFHTNFSFFTVESRLSRSLSYEFFFFHGGISAITKPFIRTFLFSR